MITVKNNEERVVVLKAANANSLRLVPGFNTVDMKDLSVYTKDNPAAQAVVKQSLSILNPKDLKAEEKKTADANKAKNDKLNKSASLLKAAQDKLAKAENKAKSSDAEMAKMAGEIKELKKQLTDLLKKVPADEAKSKGGK